MIDEVLFLVVLGINLYILYRYPKNFLRHSFFLFVLTAIIVWVLCTFLPFLIRFGLTFFFIMYIIVFITMLKFGTEEKEEGKGKEEEILEKLKKEVE